jgi:formamidopyrimidine-DNA glycosylase
LRNDGHLAYTNKGLIGRVDVADNAMDFIAREKLEPDALDPHLDLAVFEEAVAEMKRDVKSVLLDQEIVAGIGNIYSDEIRLQARIDPTTRINELSPARLKHLFEVMRTVLQGRGPYRLLLCTLPTPTDRAWRAGSSAGGVAIP